MQVMNTRPGRFLFAALTKHENIVTTYAHFSESTPSRLDFKGHPLAWLGQIAVKRFLIMAVFT